MSIYLLQVAPAHLSPHTTWSRHISYLVLPIASSIYLLSSRMTSEHDSVRRSLTSAIYFGIKQRNAKNGETRLPTFSAHMA